MRVASGVQQLQRCRLAAQGQSRRPWRIKAPLSSYARATRCGSTLEGKTYLVTGSTDGIGLHTATHLAKEGATVLVHGRDAKRVADAAVKVQMAGGQSVAAYTADLSSLQAVRQLAADVSRDFPRLDVLVNNAGVFNQSLKETEDGYEETWAVNVLAPYLLTGLLLPHVQDRVVNVSSISASSGIDWDILQQEKGFSDHGAYSLSKLAVQMLTVEMARRGQLRGVTVACLDPGTVNTKMLLTGWGSCGIELDRAFDLMWACTTDNLTSAAYYVGQREQTLRAPSRDATAVQKLWDIVEVQTGLSFPAPTRA